jgi:hypothetical protein
MFKSRHLKNLEVLRVAAHLLPFFAPSAQTLPKLRVLSIFATIADNAGPLETYLDVTLARLHDMTLEPSFPASHIATDTISIYISTTDPGVCIHRFMIKYSDPPLSSTAQITRVELMANFELSFTDKMLASIPGWLRRTFPALRVFIINDRFSLSTLWPNPCQGAPFEPRNVGPPMLEQSVVGQTFVTAMEKVFQSNVQVVFGSLESL